MELKSKELFERNCLEGADYRERWLHDDFCSSTLIENGGSPWAKSMMERLFHKAFPNGFLNENEDDGFQYLIYQTCRETPASCASGLKNTCYRYRKIDLSGLRANFCGCHLPSSEYSLYADLYGLEPVCDPVCSRLQALPQVNLEGEVKLCHSSLCLIDQVTIQLDSSQAGDITFTQTCGNCGLTNPCSCQITNVSLSAVRSKLGSVFLEQACTGEIRCFQVDQENPSSAQPVPCQENQVALTTEKAKALAVQTEIEKRSKRTSFITLLLFLLIIVVCLILIIFLQRIISRSENYNYGGLLTGSSSRNRPSYQ